MIRGLLILFALLAAVPASAAWTEATTRHFRIYSEGKPEALTAFATKLERFDATLRLRFRVADPDGMQRLTVFLLPDNKDVARLAGRGKTVAGFYESHAGGSLAVSHRDMADGKYDLGADTVLFHEYAHYFMFRNFSSAFPAWFIEGFAEYISTMSFTREGFPEVGKPPYFRSYGLFAVGPVPVKQLLASGRFEGSAERIEALYGRSWLLAHYLYADKARSAQLVAYLAALNKGDDSLTAAKAAFGDLDALDSALAVYLKQRKMGYFQMTVAVNPPFGPQLRSLSAAEGALVMPMIAVMREPGKEEAAKLAIELEALVARTPTALGWRLLAQAQFAAEKFDAADASADASLKLDPASSRAMMVKADVAIRRYTSAETPTASLAKDMRNWVVKANRADPLDPLPLAAYHRLFQLQGLKPPQTAEDGLKLAVQLAPEAIDTRMAYANALANQQKWDEAIRLVEPVANDPHGAGAGYAAAFLERLKKAKAGDKEAMESLM